MKLTFNCRFHIIRFTISGLQDSDEEDLMTQKQDELENAIEAIMGGKKAQLAISDKAANAPTKLDIRKGKTIEVIIMKHIVSL